MLSFNELINSLGRAKIGNLKPNECCKILILLHSRSRLTIMKLDPHNRAFQAALLLIEETRQNIFLTGKAGTGKTTFLHHLKERLGQKMVVVAPTGVAAVNAGGMTIHSLFQIQPSVYVPDDPRLRTKAAPGDPDRSTIHSHIQLSQAKRELLQKIELLVIDEISMVRCDLLDVIDKVLRTFGGGNAAYPFGGKQMLFIGDAFQLPPVAPSSEWEILSRHYDSPYFFSAAAFEAANPRLIELQKIYRQADPRFVGMLNRIREGEVKAQDLQELNERLRRQGRFDYARQGYIYLGTRNQAVNRRNAEQLSRLPGPIYCFEAVVSGDFTEKDMPTLEQLELKIGAQVMFIKNDMGENRRYYNGKIGQIEAIEEEKIMVECDGDLIEVERASWRKIRYEWDEEAGKIVEIETGSFIQFPLKLAWAITVHKSQGLTFERVYADLQGAFADGQVYVALSRCTALQGLYLASRISRSDIKTSEQVLRFSRQFLQQEEVEEMLQQLDFMVRCEPLELALQRGALDSAIGLLWELKQQAPEQTPALEDFERRLFRRLQKLLRREKLQRLQLRRLRKANRRPVRRRGK